MMEQYQEYIHASRYARWREEDSRRETWSETVGRYSNFMQDRGKLTISETESLFNAIHDLEVMPSMRCLMTAGEALNRDNVAGFNCAYMPIDHMRAFDEMVYILMCGTGVGFGVERKDVAKLPDLPESYFPSESVIVVADSKVGWAKAYKQLISMLYAGEIPKWDVSKVRGSGEVLKTFGGRASGPAPLVDLFQFTIETFTKAKDPKLTTLECSDLCNKIAQIVVVGGVRRSAQIGLSDPSDERLRGAKTGAFPSYRYLSNNSAVYTSKPDLSFFMKEMTAMHDSGSGERGVLNRKALQEIAARNGRRDPSYEFGTNPCSEIILRPNQFCNLTEVVIRSTDTLSDIKDKVEKATILGTLQATLTDFRYLRKIWQTNTEEEALLGVSFTGIMDHEVMSGRLDRGVLAKWLKECRDVAIETNAVWAARLGINPSAAITCVKPSGTVSQLVNSASGIHARYSSYYIRTVRADAKDPLAAYMQEAGFPWEAAIGSDNTLVFSFPVKAPDDCVTTSDQGAMESLDLWKMYQENWCEHKPSITIHYTEDEFPDIVSWMWKNFNVLSGIALLPYDDHVYQQAPYQEIKESEYSELLAKMPVFDWDEAAKYESSDMTTGGACEI